MLTTAININRWRIDFGQRWNIWTVAERWADEEQWGWCTLWINLDFMLWFHSFSPCLDEQLVGYKGIKGSNITHFSNMYSFLLLIITNWTIKWAIQTTCTFMIPLNYSAQLTERCANSGNHRPQLKKQRMPLTQGISVGIIWSCDWPNDILLGFELPCVFM